MASIKAVEEASQDFAFDVAALRDDVEELIAVRIYLHADHHDGSLITNQNALPQLGPFVLQARRTESVIQKRK
jgi:hypothetical protein